MASSILGGILTAAFGGPSRAQVNSMQQTNAMANALQSNYAQQFGQYESVAQGLNTALNQELIQGENGQGLTSAQMAGLNTQALDTTAQNFKNAEIAAQTAGAAHGGPPSGLLSGVQQQINASIASAGAGALSGQQLQIQELNANEALKKKQEALGGLGALSGEFLGGANAASAGELAQNKEAFGQESTVNQEQQQQLAGIGEAIGGGISALTGGFGNLDLTGGSTLGENVGNFGVGLLGGTSGPAPGTNTTAPLYGGS